MDWLEAFLAAPTGPGTPFATPWLCVLDGLRVFVVAATAVIVLLLPFLAATVAGSRSQAAGLVGLVCYAAAAAGTEVDHFGDYAHYRLVLIVIAQACALWRTHGMWRAGHPRAARAPKMRKAPRWAPGGLHDVP